MKSSMWGIAGILFLAGASALNGAGPNTQWVGVLWTKGSVSVGSARVASGTTVLPGDVITTGPNASAWVRFRSPASTLLLADTEVTFIASDSAPSFLLRRGTVVVDEKVADPVRVTVPGGIVLVKGDPQDGAECEMAAIGEGATVAVKRGVAEIQGQGVPVILHPGESVHVEAGPQGGEKVAGKITKVIPEGQIQREGQVQELPLRLNEVVDWNDLVRTLQVGRAQIMLLDGSTLNVGARSELKIVKHDPDKQQTEIELTLGRVEANVQKVTLPGGKFELTTRSAVIGTIDTAFVVESDNNGTRICGVDGTTTVKSSNPNIPKQVKLHRNECTFVIFGGAPTDPVFSPGEMAAMMNQTVIGGAAGGGIGGGIGGVQGVLIGTGIDAAIGASVAGVVLTRTPVTSSVTPP